MTAARARHEKELNTQITRKKNTNVLKSILLRGIGQIQCMLVKESQSLIPPRLLFLKTARDAPAVTSAVGVILANPEKNGDFCLRSFLLMERLPSFADVRNFFNSQNLTHLILFEGFCSQPFEAENSAI